MQLQPWQQCHAPPPQYLGTDGHGQPVYGHPPSHPATGGVAPLQPIVARPWAGYIALGCAAALAFVFVMIGLAILAIALAVATVCLTICVLVLRSVFRQTQREKRT